MASFLDRRMFFFSLRINAWKRKRAPVSPFAPRRPRRPDKAGGSSLSPYTERRKAFRSRCFSIESGRRGFRHSLPAGQATNYSRRIIASPFATELSATDPILGRAPLGGVDKFDDCATFQA